MQYNYSSLVDDDDNEDGYDEEEDDDDDDDSEDDADDAGDFGLGRLLIYGLPSEFLCCKKGDSPY